MTQQRFKPFFFHHDELRGMSKQTLKELSTVQRHRPRGFTMFVQPSDNPRMIKVQVAMCSPKDNFCKKIGREQALQHEIKEINARDLPKTIGEFVSKTTWGCAWARGYDYMLKYVI